jgi:hypothetical protein
VRSELEHDVMNDYYVCRPWSRDRSWMASSRTRMTDALPPNREVSHAAKRCVAVSHADPLYSLAHRSVRPISPLCLFLNH